ncbi:MAG: cation diffusion facilitator family transporter, partial [Acetatifactor sp.]|nr:cation diffusion facilitator family transporter [Acetatifactor sp.]
MITVLTRIFIQDHKDTSSPAVRQAYGILCGAVGIGLNLLLFAGKICAGLFSGSIAITADAFNNLSDAGSSIITLIGFRMAGQKPDPDHPFGHGRIEYISGFLVSLLILLMAFELIKSSVVKILHPQELVFSPVIVVILAVSIGVKCYMA